MAAFGCLDSVESHSHDQNTRVSERAEWCDFSVMVPHQYWKVSVHSLSVFD